MRVILSSASIGIENPFEIEKRLQKRRVSAKVRANYRFFFLEGPTRIRGGCRPLSGQVENDRYYSDGLLLPT